MPEVELHQALFGYSKGHRLLASSLDLDAESSRLLRTATDVAFEGKADSYLTVLPLTKLGYHAFIRTWAADGWLRPGSVWSHVILIDFVSLNKLSDPRVIESAFRRPKLTKDGDPNKEFSKYSKRFVTKSGGAASPPISRGFAATAIRDLYATDGVVTVLDKHASVLDTTMIAMHLQQWPRLRRSFAYRTRYRTSEIPWRLDLEVIERGQGGNDAGPSDQAWVSDLVADLEKPNLGLRSFLQRYGSESKAGRGDMKALVELYEGIRASSVSALRVVEMIRKSYPASEQMQTLKRDLFGAVARSEVQPWTSNENERLTLALKAGASVDFGDLAIGRRFAAIAMNGDSRALAAIGNFELGSIPTDQIEVLIADLAAGASAESALALAEAHPDLGLLVASRRPDLLAAPAMWRALDGELLIDVLDSMTPVAQTGVLLSLVAAGGSDAIAYICGRDTARWWALLFEVADRIKSASELIRAADTLRSAIDRVGAAALSSPTRLPDSPIEIVLTLLSANLSAGLWRRIQAPQWVSVAQSIASRPITRELPRYAKDRIFAVALLTATSNAASSTRSAGWMSTFSYLHEALKRSDFDGEAWGVLSNALPTGADWDRCARLRSGAIAEVRRDAWPSSQVQVLTDAAGPFGAEILASLKAAQERQQKRGLLFDLLSLFK